MPPKEKLETIEVYLTHLLENLADLDVQFSIRPGIAYVMNVKTGHIYEATRYTCDCPDFETGNGGTPACAPCLRRRQACLLADR